MPTSHVEVAVTGGVGWNSGSIGSMARKVHVEVVSTVGDDQVDVSFNGGATVHSILGPLAERSMKETFNSPSSPRISFRCASAAQIKVVSEL